MVINSNQLSSLKYNQNEFELSREKKDKKDTFT